MHEMKDSGIEWIGEIPKDWKTSYLKYFVRIKSGDSLTKSHLHESAQIPVIGGGKIIGYTTNFNCDEKNILIGRVGANCGCVTFLDGKSWATDNALIVSTNYSKSFLYYLLVAANLNHFNMSNAQPLITSTTIKNLKVVLPSNVERNRITNFLDSTCVEIDSIRRDIQSEITILKEYKKSVIYGRITYGINKNSFKHTNSQYWNKIPTDWKLKKIKYMFGIAKRIAGKEGYDVLSVTQKGIKIKDITNYVGQQLAQDYSNYQLVYPGDYVMNHMDLLTGWVDLSDKFGVTSPDYRVFELKNTKDNEKRYYKYVMQCCYMNRIFYSMGRGVANLGRWRLQTSSFNNFYVPVPPYDEQREIADYLDSKCAEIDSIINDKQKQLVILDEYKKSLIYEYVTGKKEAPVL